MPTVASLNSRATASAARLRTKTGRVAVDAVAVVIVACIVYGSAVVIVLAAVVVDAGRLGLAILPVTSVPSSSGIRSRRVIVVMVVLRGTGL
jgi:hypothetical protein